MSDCELHCLDAPGPLYTWHNKGDNSSFCKRVEQRLVRAMCSDGLFINKLNRLKCSLKDWNLKFFGNIFTQVAKAYADLDQIQTDISNNGFTDDKFTQEMHVRSVIEDLQLNKHCYLHEKGKVKWFTDGDHNTSFYHQMLKIRKHNSGMSALSIDGEITHDPVRIQDQTVDYIQSMFAAPDQPESYIQPVLSMLLWHVILNRLPTDDNLKVVGMCFPSRCDMCNAGEDGLFHLFFHCQFANLIWEFFLGHFGINNPFNGNIISFINPTNVTSFSSYVRAISIKAITYIFSKIWFERNRRIFHDKFRSVTVVIGSTMAAVKDINHFEVGIMYNSQAKLMILRNFQLPNKPGGGVSSWWLCSSLRRCASLGSSFLLWGLFWGQICTIFLSIGFPLDFTIKVLMRRIPNLSTRLLE
ncbi:hypothetical protein QYF36_008912 [Acer negundo]|nr:hypothetical protein QYF36_008912 [Acer negundo]